MQFLQFTHSAKCFRQISRTRIKFEPNWVTFILTWRGCVGCVTPVVHFFVSEFHRLLVGLIKSSWGSALWPDAPLTSVRVEAASLRRPLWYEGFHAERQVMGFVFTPPDRWQFQILGFTGCFVFWSALRSERGWRSLRRIHDARLWCHACVKNKFLRHCVRLSFLSSSVHSAEPVNSQRPATLANFIFLRTELPLSLNGPRVLLSSRRLRISAAGFSHVTQLPWLPIGQARNDGRACCFPAATGGAAQSSDAAN